MKKAFHKLLSLSMAFVVLFSTMSFTLSSHYCGESLVDFSFFDQVETCGMEKAPALSSCENGKLSEKTCCNDTALVKQGNNDLKISFDQFTITQQFFVASFTYSYINLFQGTDSTNVLFLDYAPPFYKRNVQVLHQTFLI